ncbi:hypothetical protein pdam_00015345 [Pocillopora damicornis]|uniref:Uncharacterized protein n=1 Tax=Pocillopora damicornis TaxID=46731 RepID=A0A3M6V1E1_POCDA|nr:hypothetical protein pdam_00015345 [Pocillopora damicornis]
MVLPFLPIQAILKDMRIEFEMKGSVNGHHFEIEGEGKERPYEVRRIVKATADYPVNAQSQHRLRNESNGWELKTNVNKVAKTS